MKVGLKLISNTIYLFFDWFFSTVLSFIYWVIIGKTLLPEAYGIIATSINAMLLLSGISLFGLNTAVTKLISEHYRKKGKIMHLIQFSTKIIILTNSIIFLILILFSSSLANVLKLNEILIWFIAIGTFAVSFFTITGSILYGFQNMNKYLKTNAVGNLIKVIFSLILILLGFGYFGPLMGIIFCYFSIFLLRFDLSWLKTSSNKIEKKEVFFGFALPAFISSLAWIVFNNMHYIILTVLKNPEITGYFAITVTLVSPVLVIPTTLSAASFPIISQLCVDRKAKKKQSYLIKLVLRYAVFLILPIVAFLVFFSEPVILIFSRPQYLPAASLFPILALGLAIYGCAQILLQNLYAIGKPKINRNISIFTIIIFLLSSIPLTYLFSAIGLSISFTFSTSILLLSSYYFLRKFLGLTMPWKSILKISFSTLIFLSIMYVSDLLPYSLLIKFIFAFMGALCYLMVLIPLRFYAKEDAKILEFVAKRIPPLKKQLSWLSKYISRFT